VVVREALHALEKNQSSVVPGGESIDSEFTTVLPRETLVNLWKNILGASEVKN